MVDVSHTDKHHGKFKKVSDNVLNEENNSNSRSNYFKDCSNSTTYYKTEVKVNVILKTYNGFHQNYA